MKTKKLFRSLRCGLALLLIWTVCLSGVCALSEDFDGAGGLTGEGEDSSFLEVNAGDGSEDLSDAGQAEEGGTFTCAETAVTGGVIWRVVRSQLICTEAATGNQLATLPIEAIPELAGESLSDEDVILGVNVVSFADAAVICLPRMRGEECTVSLYALAWADGKIELREAWDVSGALSAFYHPASGWYGITLLPWGEGLYLGALDSDFTIHRYYFQPREGILSERGDHPMLYSQIMIPCGKDLLMVCLSVEEENTYDLIRLDSAGGETAAGSFSIGSSVAPWNFACEEGTGRIFFTAGTMAYRFTLGAESAPEAFAVFPEMPSEIGNGMVADNQYAVLTDAGGIMSADTTQELSVKPLRIANIAAEITVSDAASLYNSDHPDLLVTAREGGTEAGVLEAMLNGDSQYDIYVVSNNTEAFDALRDRGYMAPLDGSALLTALSADYSEAMRREVGRDGVLYAMPIYVENHCPILNTAALCEVAGLQADELPTDWVSFLTLLKRIAEEGLLQDNETYSLSESYYTSETFREQMLSWILNDCWLWLDQDAARVEQLQQVLTPVLRAFNEVPFSSLGFDDSPAEGLGWFVGSEKIKLFYPGNPEIAVLEMTEDEQFWPLSLAEGGERLIPQMINAAFINPYSVNREDALRFLENVWDAADPLAQMMICESMNEPVLNEEYDEDMAYFEAMIPEYEQAIQNAKTQGEAEMLTYELESMKEFMESYRENAAWSASEESIAAYRALESQIRPAVQEFWSMDQEDKAVLQFLDGMMDANLFVNQLQAALRMHQNEVR